ncbi:YceD family protein [Sphingomonas sp. DT-51]|uniref:YceD family protein n=1 Tax=Sphingomonas sp. DT-51 TaxID=3396165 RepID=UPI003F1A5F2C
MTTEFSRIERLDVIGGEDRRVTIAAEPDERAALARRFDLVAVERLDADLLVRRDAAGVLVRGTVRAAVVQACSVTGDPLPATIEEPVALRFIAPGEGADDEIELGSDSIDTVELEGGGVDLGETAAETMALALDPFPRSPRAEAVLRAAGVLSEEEAGPFGALAGLKARLAKGSDEAN